MKEFISSKDIVKDHGLNLDKIVSRKSTNKGGDPRAATSTPSGISSEEAEAYAKRLKKLWNMEK